MCGDAACFKLSQQTGATYHRTNAPWIDWTVWCRTLGVDPELTVKSKSVVSSQHFLPKYFRYMPALCLAPARERFTS